jgi:ABC-type transporter Mla subunit MlaD
MSPPPEHGGAPPPDQPPDQPPDRPPNGPNGPNGPDDEDPWRQLAAARAQIRLLTDQRDQLQQRLDQAQGTVNDLQQQVGRLAAQVDQLASVTQERDDLRRQLAEAQASLSQRVADAVQAHLGPITEAHAGEVSAITAERDDLRAQLNELQQQGTETATTMTATDLASHFVGVLNSLAQPAEPAPPGRPFAAAITAINVQAKGLLRAPEQKGGEVQLVTVDAGKVDPAQLSTVNLDVKLLPQLAPPAAGTPPAGPGEDGPRPA